MPNIVKGVTILIFLSVLTALLSFIFFIYTASGTFNEITFFLFSYALIIVVSSTFIHFLRLSNIFKKPMSENSGDSEILDKCEKLKSFSLSTFYVLYAIAIFFSVFRIPIM